MKITILRKHFENGQIVINISLRNRNYLMLNKTIVMENIFTKRIQIIRVNYI